MTLNPFPYIFICPVEVGNVTGFFFGADNSVNKRQDSGRERGVLGRWCLDVCWMPDSSSEYQHRLGHAHKNIGARSKLPEKVSRSLQTSDLADKPLYKHCKRTTRVSVRPEDI